MGRPPTRHVGGLSRLGKAPEYDADPNADLPQEVLAERLSELFDATSKAISAALRLIKTAWNVYLDSLPTGVVTVVPLDETSARG